MRHQAFILRLWQDEHQHVWGQLVLPQSDERLPFASLQELLALIQAQVQATPIPQTVDRAPIAEDDRASLE
jgi:hypothetical protein